MFCYSVDLRPAEWCKQKRGIVEKMVVCNKDWFCYKEEKDAKFHRDLTKIELVLKLSTMTEQKSHRISNFVKKYKVIDRFIFISSKWILSSK